MGGSGDVHKIINIYLANNSTRRLIHYELINSWTSPSFQILWGEASTELSQSQVPVPGGLILSEAEGRRRRLGEGQEPAPDVIRGRHREVGSGGSPIQKRGGTNPARSGSL